MHIPDGYLGPYTYIAMWIIMIPIWYYAGKKLSAELKSRQVPLLALAAAFSFVIMMFNVPIPGGSTGHAVGGAIIGIVLGPWAGIIAISVALVLQALMFGDGGITAIAANCFNMAVMMPFVGYYGYKIISGNSDINSSRRVIAAAIAGYIAITLAAGLTGFEFGIQPLLHQTAEGVPLYMPYPLSVTVPAMLIEHVFGFSFLEGLITALIFAYIQKTDISILYGEESRSLKKKPNAAATARGENMDNMVRNFAIGLVVLIILAPLGLLAVGETFGEWGSEELKEKIGYVPQGLEQLSSFWSAPLPDYAFPGGENSESMTLSAAAYILSAVIGVVVCGGLLYIVGKKVARG